MDMKTQGTLEMSAAMAISGTIGWFVVQSGLPALQVVFWRCAFGAVALGLVCWAMGLLRGVLTWRTALWAALGGVAIVTNWLLLFGAYSHASISIATAVYNTQPFMLVVFGALLFGERVTLSKLGWLATAFAGMLLIVQAKPGAGTPGSNYMVGIAMALGAAFFWAVASVVAKRLTGTPPSHRRRRRAHRDRDRACACARAGPAIDRSRRAACIPRGSSHRADSGSRS